MGNCGSQEPALIAKKPVPERVAGSDAARAEDPPPPVHLDDNVYYWRVLPSAVLFAEWGSYWRIFAGVAAASGTRTGVPMREAERLFGMSLASRDKRVDVFISVTPTAGRWRAHIALLHARHHAAATQLALVCFTIFGCWALVIRVVYDERLPTWLAVALLLVLPMLCYAAVLLFGHRVSLAFHAFHHAACVHAARGGRLREAGIRTLGSAIKHTREHVAIWSPGLFGRLWPVVEMALTVHHSPKPSDELAKDQRGEAVPSWKLRPRKLTLVPRWLAMTLVLTLVVHALSMSVAVQLAPALSVSPSHRYHEHINGASNSLRALGAASEPGHAARLDATFWTGVSGVPLIGFCMLLRYRARQRAEAESQLAAFDFQVAALADEADRRLFYALIKGYWPSTEAFEQFVRADLLAAVQRTLGAAWTVPLSWCLFACMPAWWYGVVDAVTQPYALAVRQTRADVPCYALTAVIYHLVIGVVCLPLALLAAAASAWLLRGLPFALGVLVDWVLLLTCTFCLVLILTEGPHQLFEQCASDNDRFF